MKGSSFRRESGYKAASEAIKSGTLPQALICANDIVAISAIEAFENNGYDVPEDISVMGFDDIAYAALRKINLTTVAQPKYEIGSLAAQIILDKINNPSGIGEKINTGTRSCKKRHMQKTFIEYSAVKIRLYYYLKS